MSTSVADAAPRRIPPPVEGRLIDAELFVADGAGLMLAGSRCSACGSVAFPSQLSCSRCTGDDVVTIPLPASGRLWGFTVQGFPPKPPYVRADDRLYVPYAVGYVDLDGLVLVEGRIVASDVATLEIGAEMHLVLELLCRDDAGPVFTYAFSPVADPGADVPGRRQHEGERR